jgi:hypothetical protein
VDPNVGGASSQSTQTLTVWRKLYVEEDRMDHVRFFEGPADLQSLMDGGVTGGAGTGTLDTDMTIAVDNRFQGGASQFWQFGGPGGDVLLGNGAINSNTTGANSSATFGANTPADTDHVYILDDDGENLAVAGRAASATARIEPIDNPPDTTLFNDRDYLPAACIEADFAVLDGNDNVIGFELNVDDENATVAGGKGVRGGELFWVSSVGTSYQYDATSSCDPDNGPCTRGISCPYWAGGVPANATGGCLTFHEAIRDWVVTGRTPGDTLASRVRRTTLHETGHLMGGRHEDGGLMASPGGTTPNGGAFSGLSLRRFMLLRNEGPGTP